MLNFSVYVINMIVYLNISFDVVQFTVHNFCHVHHVHVTFKVYLVVIPKFNYRYLGKVFVVQIYLKFNC